MAKANEIAVIIARLDRIEATLASIIAKSEPGDRLRDAIEAETGGDWFLSGELFRMASAEADAAAATGNPAPELSEALAAAGVVSSHGLGAWLGKRPDAFERGGIERGGVQWRAVPRGEA